MAERKNNTTRLTVVTPYRNFYDGVTESVIIPTPDGEIGIMAGRTPLLAALKPGIAMMRTGEERRYFTVSEGFAEVGSNGIVIVCNSAEYPEDINIRRMCDSYKSGRKQEEEIVTIEDEAAKKVARKEVTERLGRASARRHIIELYGSEQQKQRLTELRAEYNWQ